MRSRISLMTSGTPDKNLALDLVRVTEAGALAALLERRLADPRAEAMLAAIHHTPTGQQLAAERGFLARLDGSCETPIAGLAVLEGSTLWLRGEILRPDGTRVIAGELRGPVADAAAIGAALADQVLAKAGPGFFD